MTAGWIVVLFFLAAAFLVGFCLGAVMERRQR